MSAILALVFAVAVLAAGLCSATILIRSVVRPLHQLRAGAVELTEVWLPDALRTISRAGGEGRPTARVGGWPSRPSAFPPSMR